MIRRKINWNFPISSRNWIKHTCRYGLQIKGDVYRARKPLSTNKRRSWVLLCRNSDSHPHTETTTIINHQIIFNRSEAKNKKTLRNSCWLSFLAPLFAVAGRLTLTSVSILASCKLRNGTKREIYIMSGLCDMLQRLESLQVRQDQGARFDRKMEFPTLLILKPMKSVPINNTIQHPSTKPLQRMEPFMFDWHNFHYSFDFLFRFLPPPQRERFYWF